MTTVIVWDEAPMIHQQEIEVVNRMLQDVSSCALSFGDKFIIIFCHDFFHIHTMVQKGTKKDVMKASLVHSPL